MLLMGHLGEANKIDKQKALYAGFAFYMLLMGIIWFHLLHESDIHHHKLIFLVFAIVWAMYGIAYTLDEKTKNIMYNFLDVISKAMFGIFMWIYYGNVFAFA
jgi:bacteriorhodopsin